MIDPESLAIAVVGSSATANPTEDYKTKLPMTVVETVSSVPLEYGPALEASDVILQLSTIDSSRAGARAASWSAHAALVNGVGTATDQGAITYSRANEQPFQQRSDSYSTEDGDYYVFVSTVRLIVQSTK